jgi:transposase
MRQFANDDEGISKAVRYITNLQPTAIVLEATDHLEMPLAEELQVVHLRVAIINPCQVCDFGRATGALAKTDTIDARILALYGTRVKPEIRLLPDKKAREIGSFLTRCRHSSSS